MAKGCGRRHWVLAAALLLVSACTTTSPGVVAREATPIGSGEGSETLPDDPGVRILKLANGLTVYLRANDRPGGSAEMRLAINAGSAQEDADQAGTAHFLEHMMFNGTAKFPANELIATLRRIRHDVRSRRQRVHVVRRDRVRAHRADDRPGQPHDRPRRAARVDVGGHARPGRG